MRPAISFLQSLVCLQSPTQKPLIACAGLGYDRQFMPVNVNFDHGKQSLNSGEAEMDRKGPNRTKPNQDPTSLVANSQPETLDERLARIRAEIDSGLYETPEKLEIAISRMLGVITD